MSARFQSELIVGCVTTGVAYLFVQAAARLQLGKLSGPPLCSQHLMQWHCWWPTYCPAALPEAAPADTYSCC